MHARAAGLGGDTCQHMPSGAFQPGWLSPACAAGVPIHGTDIMPFLRGAAGVQGSADGSDADDNDADGERDASGENNSDGERDADGKTDVVQEHVGDSPLETAVSQEDHPFLGRPFFQVHPCVTQDVLGLMLPRCQAGMGLASDDPATLQRYMTAWLSVVCHVVPLTVPLTMVRP